MTESRGSATTVPPLSAIVTPCVRLCRLDPAGRFCVGCLRTRAEIGGWSGFTPAERDRIMADLAARRAAGFGAGAE